MRPITVTRRAELQACTCESPVCSLAHAPAIHRDRPGLHQAVVARIVRVRHRAEPMHEGRLAHRAWVPT